MSNERHKNVIYRVQFQAKDNHYDLYVRHVYPADMAGFICLEDFVFNEESQLLIDPRSEKLRNEFANVETAFIPYHQIQRIDQVSRAGESRIDNQPSEVAKIQPFPTKN